MGQSSVLETGGPEFKSLGSGKQVIDSLRYSGSRKPRASMQLRFGSNMEARATPEPYNLTSQR
jgi:hypothetical protein